MEIRFTHAVVSSAFRSGDALDDIIKAGLNDPSVMDPFPPMELVRTDSGKVYSLSNRRLFVFRVLANAGLVKTVRAVIYAERHPRVQQLRYDTWLCRQATKWERSFSTRCDGEFVKNDSIFWYHQFSQCFASHSPSHSYEQATATSFISTEPKLLEGRVQPPQVNSSAAGIMSASWNRASLKYGTLDATGTVFTKTSRTGAMKLIYESALRHGGRHRYRVSILEGQLAATDRICFFLQSWERHPGNPVHFCESPGTALQEIRKPDDGEEMDSVIRRNDNRNDAGFRNGPGCRHCLPECQAIRR